MEMCGCFDLTAARLPKSPNFKGNCFTCSSPSEMRAHSLTLGQGRVRLGIGTSSPKSSQALAWTVWGVGESPSLEVFQDSGAVALRDVISERSGVGWGWTWRSERSLPILTILWF